METVLAPGIVVAGKYALTRPLARGAMGEVWIATHRTLGNEVAVKFLARTPDHEGEDEATAMARFQFEAQVASKLSRRTRHIVAVTDHGEELGFAYLVMELVEGESLEDRMRREGLAQLSALGPIVSQLAKGLGAAHAEGVFHRDLKPANVLLTKDEDGQLLVKILDFGIAKTVRSHKIEQHRVGHTTEVGIVLGTPNYMSPEQARGLASLDHRCDLWALGTIIYESLCGALPYDGETTADLLVNVCSSEPVPASSHRADLPASVEAFFSRMFAPDVRDRFQDAASLAAAFARIVQEAHPKLRLEVVDLAPVEERSISGVVDAASYEPPRSRLPLMLGLGASAVLVIVFLLAHGGKHEEKAAAAQPEPTHPVEQASVVLPTPPVVPASVTEKVIETPPAPVPKIAGKSIPKAAPPPVAAKPASSATVTAAPPPPPPPPPPVKKPQDKGEIL
ncbi:MAG: serine/threonine-protein kinase [Polyangiales bacterium]